MESCIILGTLWSLMEPSLMTFLSDPSVFAAWKPSRLVFTSFGFCEASAELLRNLFHSGPFPLPFFSLSTPFLLPFFYLSPSFLFLFFSLSPPLLVPFFSLSSPFLLFPCFSLSSLFPLPFPFFSLLSPFLLPFFSPSSPCLLRFSF